MRELLTFNSKKINIPDKCTGGCHFRVQYSYLYYCTLYWQSIGHIKHAKKCRVKFIKMYKSEKAAQTFYGKSPFSISYYKITYCLSCPFLHSGPDESSIFDRCWCSLYKIYINEISFCSCKEEKKAAKKRAFKKCGLNYVITFEEPLPK